MDVVSYLLGKQAGGGDTPTPSGDYFTALTNGGTQTPGILSCIKTFPADIEVSGTSLAYTFKNCTGLTQVPLFDTSNVKNMTQTFYNCYSITEIPKLDTSSVTNFMMTFFQCSSLVTIPVLDTSSATSLDSTFSSCFNFSNETLNNILIMCINAKNYSGNKTLYATGLSSSYAGRIPSLPKYQDFLDAGWTMGF